MAFVPPHHLDPHIIIRNPDSVPIILRRGVYDVLKKESSGSMHNKFMKAFNVVAHGLTESGRFVEGTLKLTPLGVKREDEVRRLQDTRIKLYWVARWAKALYDKDPTLYSKTWWEARAFEDEGV